MTLTPKNSGWIEVICGPMFSGKTEELFADWFEPKLLNRKLPFSNPSTDNRFEEDYIVSHNQTKNKIYPGFMIQP